MSTKNLCIACVSQIPIIRRTIFTNFTKYSRTDISGTRKFHTLPGLSKQMSSAGLPKRATLTHEQTDRLSQGDISDFDIYNGLAAPINNIDAVLDQGFRLSSGVTILSKSKEKPTGLVLLGTEAFELDLSNSIKGLDTGILELNKDVLGIFEVSYPKPELLVVGTGSKTRVLHPRFRQLISSMGIQMEVSSTVSKEKKKKKRSVLT